MKFTLRLSAVIALVMFTCSLAAAPANDDPLARSKAMYAGLKSYADTGFVDEEYGPARGRAHDRHSFTTFYRGPRHVFFDFTKAHNTDRFVVWSNDDNTLHIWWKTTHKEETYGKGQWQTPLLIGGTQTKGSLMQLFPYFLAEDKLFGTLTELGDTKVVGQEMVGSHQCFKIVGTAKSVYQGTGHVVNIRPTTVWIDAQTLLVRKVMEDTPQGSAPGWLQRVTTTFEPQANPNLSDAQFQFKPPAR